jgi:hypothetical protein
MRRLIVAVVFALGMGLLWAAPASAQNAPAYRYCLLDGSHPDTTGMVLCRFDTLGQCMASRNSLNDTCYVNPEFPGRRK